MILGCIQSASHIFKIKCGTSLNHNYNCCRVAYVTHEDICRCFKDETLLAIQAPSGTQLEVPIPDAVSKYKMRI